MKIAITGSSGMIGSTMAKMAIDNGHEVISIIRPGSKRAKNLPTSDRIKTIECDISEYNKISETEQCDIFFHLAWDKTTVNGRDDVYTQYKNIGYALDAVNLANSWNASVFVGAGSQAEYGHVDCKLDGNTSTNPESGYGIAKLTAGRMCKLLCNQLGIRFNWARILSVYGELDSDQTLITYLIRTLMAGESPQLTKCEQTWDYIYSDDASSAMLAIGLEGKDGKTYCIGSGEGRPLKDFVSMVRDVIDPKLSLDFGVKEYYPHQAMILCADTTDLRRDTGFQPKYSFEEGIARTINYMRQKVNDDANKSD